MAVLGYAESASVAQDLATRHGYDVDPDRELLAIGAANGLAGLLGGFMVAGGASQSAANDRAGARTQAAGLLVAVLALVTALFLTPLFFYLPEAVLGAIVLFAIMGFFRTGELRRIARLSRLSFIGALVALIGVLVLGVLPGLMLAVGLSIVMLLTRAARPGLSLLGRDPAAGAPPDGALPAVYGDLTQNAALRPVPGLLIVRPNAPLFFGNVRAVRQQVLDLARRDGAPGAGAGAGPLPAAPDGSPDRALLLDIQMSPSIDIETADTLAQLRTTLAGEGRTLWLGGVHDSGRTLLLRAGYAATLAEGRIFPNVASAVHAFEHPPALAPAPAGRVEQ
jgi:MFS superfamily sulfate permease-like transporter